MVKFNRFISKVVNKRGLLKNKILQINNPKFSVRGDLPRSTQAQNQGLPTIVE